MVTLIRLKIYIVVSKESWANAEGLTEELKTDKFPHIEKCV
jgi:hypothetical protein